jgi:hypothetical protein
MLACIIILILCLAVPITLATAALFRPEIGAKTEPDADRRIPPRLRVSSAH